MRTILIIITLVTFSCSSTKKTTQVASNNNEPTQVASNNNEPTQEEEKDNIFLYFERTLCYGECPAFKITVFSDGRSLYEGVRFVEKLGEYEARLSAAQMKEIREEAVRIGFYDFQDKYDASVSDVPTCITMISADKGRKRVEDRFDGPEVLHAFEKYLDRVLLGLDWKYRD